MKNTDTEVKWVEDPWMDFLNPHVMLKITDGHNPTPRSRIRQKQKKNYKGRIDNL